MKNLRTIATARRKLTVSIAVCTIAMTMAPCAIAATCLVSDPLGHSDDTPIAGTYTTATSSTPSSLDSRPWMSFLADGWTLFKQIGFILSFR